MDNEADSNDINPATTEGKRIQSLTEAVTVLRSLRTVERLDINFSENHYSTNVSDALRAWYSGFLIFRLKEPKLSRCI